MPVDVVTVTYESARTLAACVRALPDTANVIIVDNASADGSAELAASLGAVVVRNERNLGFARAANLGARHGSADLVLFLNPDAAIDARSLAILVDAIATDPSTGAVGPQLRREDGDEEQAFWPFPSPRSSWAEALGLRRWRTVGPLEDGSVPFVVGACLLVRRNVLEALGGFDERFWLYGEEADLCRRLWNHGWRVRHIREATATHVGAHSGQVVPALAFEHFQRGAEHFIAKHHGRAGLVAHRIALLGGSLARLALLAVRGEAGRSRRELRRAIAVRLARTLVLHPTRVTP